MKVLGEKVVGYEKRIEAFFFSTVFVMVGIVMVDGCQAADRSGTRSAVVKSFAKFEELPNTSITPDGWLAVGIWRASVTV